MTTERLDFADLDNDLCDVVNMSSITCRLIEDAGDRTPQGYYRVTGDEWNSLLFATYHTNNLLKALQKRWGQACFGETAKGGDA